MRRLLCLLGWHRPIREQVRWDGMRFIGDCRDCRAAVRRIRAKAWRRR